MDCEDTILAAETVAGMVGVPAAKEGIGVVADKTDVAASNNQHIAQDGILKHHIPDIGH